MGKGNSAPKRSKAEIERDRVEIAKYYLMGWTQVQIRDKICADHYGDPNFLTRQAIALDLKAIQAEWLQSSLCDFDKAKARELAKIDLVEQSHWAAWERSQGETTIRTIKTIGVGGENRDNAKTERVIRQEERLGDPRHLEGVLKCIERRCRLLGLDSPEKLDVMGDLGDGAKDLLMAKLVPELAAGRTEKKD